MGYSGAGRAMSTMAFFHPISFLRMGIFAVFFVLYMLFRYSTACHLCLAVARYNYVSDAAKLSGALHKMRP